MSGSLLDSIARPIGINPLDNYRKALSVNQGINENALFQARRAQGQAFQSSIRDDGSTDQAAYLRGIKADPNAGLGAVEAAQGGQTLSADEYTQKMKRGSYGAALAAQILTDNDGKAAPLDALKSMYDRSVKDGHMTQTQEDEFMSGFGPDPVANASVVRQRMMGNIGNMEALSRANGTFGTATGPNGSQIGTRQNSQTGALSTPDQQPGVPLGLSPESNAGVSTITNPDGSHTTDTLQGHFKAGRLTSPSPGALAPGYSASDATPAMVTALRGQEGTPDGRTSVAGARGQMQVTQGFFKQYAQPGESFDSKADVEAVAKRGIAALEAKYPNDPGRVATAYFSGEGNVAPAGSPQPYKADVKDANGASTSGYAAGATSRYNAANAAGPKQKPGGTTVPAGTETASTLSANAMQKISDEGTASRPRAALLDNMLGDTTQFTTGPGTDAMLRVRQIAERFGYPVDKDATSAAESFKKLVAQINAGQGSDARLAVSEAGNVHADMSPGGVDLMLRSLRGNEDYIQARQKLAASHQGSNRAFEAGVGAKLDPRTFQYDRMTPTQKKTYFTSLTSDKAKNDFIKSHDETAALLGNQ